MAEEENVQDKIALLKNIYLEQLPGRLAEIEQAFSISSSSEPDDARQSLKSLSALAHKLAGSGATFGFPKISETAKAFENGCEMILETGDLTTDRSINAVSGWMSSLRKSMENAGSVEVDHELLSVIPNDKINEGESGRVILVSDDGELTDRLTIELGNFEYAVISVSPDSDMDSVFSDNKPLAIVVDMDSQNEEGQALARIDDMAEKHVLDCILIAISDRGDLLPRLQAARAGVGTYLLKPVTATDLVDVLDQHSTLDSGEDIRVMIVDDDISTSKYTEIILRGARMLTEIVNDPMDFLEKVDSFGPELILMDLYMPGCSGQELAAVMRQQEGLSGIPIVFLSSEDNLDKQLIAMRAGGDDFLTKPVQPRHLISSIRSRVRRFRILRSRMVRDSMTGLLNHTTSHEFFENEVARAHRNKGKLALAALDIDHFKSVNDNYGHATGDQVIKSLTRLLKQRLRTTDIVGRMGGEEFAALLVDANIDQAQEILEGIRIAFSDIVHRVDEKKFSVTLSCGIAAFTGKESSEELLEAADKALYQAKHGGRNQVVLSS
ncbi:MAG: diguanylate cyclase [Rhodospirillaceae bacterium]|nr:diguanylate cyclase [Rhodospirillaceae bacterium]